MTSYDPETWGHMDKPWPWPDPTNAEIVRLRAQVAELEAFKAGVPWEDIEIMRGGLYMRRESGVITDEIEWAEERVTMWLDANAPKGEPNGR